MSDTARNDRSGPEPGRRQPTGSAENPLNAIAPPIPRPTPERHVLPPPGGSAGPERHVLPPPGGSSGPDTHASAAAAQVVAYARAQLGRAYRLGGVGPESFDCSGLVLAAYRTVGIDLPRTSQAQSRLKPAPATPAAGDILYWGVPGAATHVALYVGDGRFIGAQNPRTGVVERPVAGSAYTGVVRVLP